MSKILLSFGKLSIASKLLTSSVFVALLATLNTTVQAQTSTTPPPTQSQPVPQINSIALGLLGQWQAKSPSSSDTINLIFTPQGKLFIFFPNAENSVNNFAAEFQYRINPRPKPMHLDITIPNLQEPVLTIFELTANGQLRLQLQGTNPGQPRPTAFSSEVSVFKKISNATTLPDNLQVIDPETDNPESNQSVPEGKAYIGAINRAQQAYYLEQEKFAQTIEQLSLGIKPETENYSYRIVSQGKPKQNQIAISTAAAKKPELTSYTGIVFLKKVEGELLSFSAICETDKPSTRPPAIPKVPLKESQAVQCPRGSHLLAK